MSDMQSKSLIEPKSKNLIFIHEEAMQLINSYRQSQPTDCEAGGLLIGKRRGPHFEITAATPPQSDDLRSRYQFVRFEDGHQQLAQALWSASNCEDTYLGELHTHPEDLPTPSSLDLKEWKKAGKRHQEILIFIIVGIQSNYYTLLTSQGYLCLKEYS